MAANSIATITVVIMPVSMALVVQSFPRGIPAIPATCHPFPSCSISTSLVATRLTKIGDSSACTMPTMVKSSTKPMPDAFPRICATLIRITAAIIAKISKPMRILRSFFTSSSIITNSPAL